MAEYDGQNRRAPERWKVKKEVSLGDLIAFACAFASVAYSWSTLDSRVKVLEDNRSAQQKTDDRQDSESVRYQARIESVLSKIDAKLDRLAERR